MTGTVAISIWAMGRELRMRQREQHRVGYAPNAAAIAWVSSYERNDVTLPPFTVRAIVQSLANGLPVVLARPDHAPRTTTRSPPAKNSFGSNDCTSTVAASVLKNSLNSSR